MGKEMRELHKVHKLAIKLIKTGRISWTEAVEKAKEQVREDYMLDKKEIIEQLKSLKAHCESMKESGEEWKKDIQALEYAIKELKITAQEVPVQEQLKCEYLGCNTKLILDDVEVSPGIVKKKYVCEKHLGELNKNILKISNIKK